MTGSLGLACSLTDAELSERRDEWHAIEGALVERTEHDGVEEAYRRSPELRQELARLVELERRCCTGARWDLREDGDLLRVSVTAT